MVELTWTLQRVGKQPHIDYQSGDQLRIDYRVMNHRATSVQLVDRLLWQHEPNPDVIIVRNDSLPNTIAYTRTFVRTNELMHSTPYPTVRMLDPGESVEGRAFAAWPFAWHNFSRVDELKPGATHAVLEVGYIDTPGAKLEAMTLPSGVVYTTRFGSQKLPRSEVNVKPLPEH
jgi:hypothetical protein